MSDTHGYVDRGQRRRQMLEAIRAYSEDRWAAGWLIGIEKQVREEGGLWTVMAAACDGWPLGYQAEHGWDPLTEGERASAERMWHADPEARG